MAAVMTKARLVEMMREGRARWEQLLARVGVEEMAQPGPNGDWSIRDIVAHVAYYEKWLARWLEDAVRGRVTAATHRDTLDVDKRNALIFQENRDRATTEVLAESHAVFERLLQLVQALPEDDLLDPHRFERFITPFWGQSEPLWECIAGDSYEHYQEHIPVIESRLESARA